MRLEWTLWPYAGLAVLAVVIWLSAGAVAAGRAHGLLRFAALALLAPAIVPGHGELVVVSAAQLLTVNLFWAQAYGALWMFGFALTLSVLLRLRQRQADH